MPRFSDLNFLLEMAKRAAKHASLAVEGLNTEFDDQARRDREKAEGYAACVLDGLERVVQSPSRVVDPFANGRA
jgi:hypothetical protein